LSEFIGHEPCPICGSRDNLARYDSGSAFCFGCRRYFPTTIQNRIAAKNSPVESEKSIGLPSDYDPQYHPKEALDWISQYGFNRQRMFKYRIGWSEYNKRLVFPIITHNRLLAWQGRSFTAKPKWKTQGDIHSFLWPLKYNSNKLVLVEDIISAYNVHEAGYGVAPLFGSHITNAQLTGILKNQYSEVVFWLDRDKYKEAVQMAGQIGEVGIKSSFIVTDKDPKEYKDIKGILK